MVEKKIEEKQLVSMDNIKELYPWADHIDQAIIEIILNSNKSMSIFTLKNRFEQKIEFIKRIENMTKKIPSLKIWTQNKPTPQIGTEKMYLDSNKEEASKTGSSSYSKVQSPQEMQVNNNAITEPTIKNISSGEKEVSV